MLDSNAPSTCILCGGGRHEPVATGEDYEYGSLPGPFHFVSCASCGHVYLDPLPPPEALDAIYPPTYYTTNPRSPLYLRGFIYETKLRRDADRILALLKKTPRVAILDVGCGDARRLAAIGKKLAAHADLVGLDIRISADVRGFARRNGVESVEANVERDLSALGDRRFDLVIMSQLIEHLRDPVRALVGLAERLAASGRILIETPNVGGLDHRLFRARYWGGYHFPRHFHLFTADSLRRLVQKAGLAPVGHGFLPSPGFWIISLRNALGLSSAERSRRAVEFLSFSSLPAVGAFTAVDLVRAWVGLETSNQYLLCERESRARGIQAVASRSARCYEAPPCAPS